MAVPATEDVNLAVPEAVHDERGAHGDAVSVGTLADGHVAYEAVRSRRGVLGMGVARFEPGDAGGQQLGVVGHEELRGPGVAPRVVESRDLVAGVGQEQPVPVVEAPSLQQVRFVEEEVLGRGPAQQGCHVGTAWSAAISEFHRRQNPLMEASSTDRS